MTTTRARARGKRVYHPATADRWPDLEALFGERGACGGIPVFFGRSRVLRPLDEKAVWSVSCLFVAKPYRRQGVSTELLREAVRFARKHGARIVEGYPVLPNSDAMPPVFAWTGTRAAFVAAGFIEAGRHSEKRPIMRVSR